jgi:hypothetical protein
MAPAWMPFYIVYPTTDTPDRLLTATVVRIFDTAAEAFADIEWVRLQLRREDFRTGVIKLVVVNERREEVHRVDAQARTTDLQY